MSDKKLEYYNFPIQLLNGFMDDPVASLEKITAYNIYYWSNDWKDDVTASIPLNRVLKFLRLTDTEYMRNFLGLGETIYNSIPNNSPTVGIRRNVLIDYWVNIESKSKYDLIALVAHLALKSIIGRSKWKKVYYDFWFSRMDGKVHKVDFSELSPSISEFNTTHKKDRIKKKLTTFWGLEIAKGEIKNINTGKNQRLTFRGLIVSYKMNHIELYEKALQLKEGYRIKEMERRKKKELQEHLRKKKERNG